jgi:hypothetical protein
MAWSDFEKTACDLEDRLSILRTVGHRLTTGPSYRASDHLRRPRERRAMKLTVVGGNTSSGSEVAEPDIGRRYSTLSVECARLAT